MFLLCAPCKVRSGLGWVLGVLLLLLLLFCLFVCLFVFWGGSLFEETNSCFLDAKVESNISKSVYMTEL